MGSMPAIMSRAWLMINMVLLCRRHTSKIGTDILNIRRNMREISNEKVTWCKNDHLSCSRVSNRFIRQEWETQCNDSSLGRNMLLFPALCNRIAEKGHIYICQY